MVTTINDDMFTAEVIQDPYRYYSRIREEDPVNWNELYELWVVTRHDDLVWMTRNNEQFSNAVTANDQRPAYPSIYESDNEIYDYTATIPDMDPVIVRLTEDLAYWKRL
jgi:cytochrome P450